MKTQAVIRGALLGVVLGLAVHFALRPWKPSAVLVSNPVVAMLFGAILGGLASCAAASHAVTFQPSRRVQEMESTEHLERLLESTPVLLIMFYADWCASCQDLKPAIHKLAEEYGSRIAVASVNVEELRIPGPLRVSGIPEVRIYCGGKENDRVSGVQPRSRYVKAIEAALAECVTKVQESAKENAR